MQTISVYSAQAAQSGLQEQKIAEGSLVNVRIISSNGEGKYTGIVAGARKTFTVRKISYGVGVERVFPYNSPRIQKVEVVRPGKVRRAKLYYLRDKIGKDAKVKTLVGAKVTAAMQARNAAANAAAAAKEAPAEETAQN